MNEFEGKTLEQLKYMSASMLGYKQGSIDTINVIKDFVDTACTKTVTLWDEKIALCEAEINKLEKENAERI
jgi:hypothetical protein